MNTGKKPRTKFRENLKKLSNSCGFPLIIYNIRIRQYLKKSQKNYSHFFEYSK